MPTNELAAADSDGCDVCLVMLGQVTSGEPASVTLHSTPIELT
jgi:hypothetical protein